ncbi:MAG: FliH/SctL family protein [bacterium]
MPIPPASNTRILKGKTGSSTVDAFRYRPIGALGNETVAQQEPNPPAATGFDEEAIRRAYEEGYRAGREIGIEVGRDEARGKLAALHGLLADLDGLTMRLLRRAETQAVDLVLAISKAVLRREISVRPESILDMVRHAIALIESHEAVEVHVHPNVLHWIERDGRAAYDGLLELAHVQIRGDSALAEDGFRVVAIDADLSADVAQQVDEIARRLELPTSERAERRDQLESAVLETPWRLELASEPNATESR